MSVQASSSRSAAKSIGSAFVQLLITLVFCTVVMLAFLLAPLAALGVAYLAFLMWRPRSKRSAAPAAPGEPQLQQRSPGVAHGFGAGAS